MESEDNLVTSVLTFHFPGSKHRTDLVRLAGFSGKHLPLRMSPAGLWLWFGLVLRQGLSRNPGCPGTCYVDQAGPKTPRALHASAPGVLGLKMWFTVPTTLGFGIFQLILLFICLFEIWSFYITSCLFLFQ